MNFGGKIFQRIDGRKLATFFGADAVHDRTRFGQVRDRPRIGMTNRALFEALPNSFYFRHCREFRGPLLL